MWFFKKRKFIDLEKNDKKIIYNNEDFIKISQKIYDFCYPNVLEESQREILTDSEITNPTNSGTKKYNNSIFQKLDLNLQKEVYDLAESELLISTAAKYLNVFPILDKLDLYHNIPRDFEDVRGAQLWHKDDFGYKSLDLFIAISDINENNGPLKVLEKLNKYGVFFKSDQENKKKNTMGERGKISNDYFENLKNNKDYKIISLKGKKGTALFIDSFTSYHRGGHCSKEDRLMLRFSYQTPDAVRVKPNRTFLLITFLFFEYFFVLMIFLFFEYFFVLMTFLFFLYFLTMILLSIIYLKSFFQL
ncbi:phytanoyl-CoA dioxygenase family protein [Pelagibacterales bacterium SAG-MED39]|nr:phytanoyl-CoA dioxygenase family protein [Pelagibacterales bacterium SAG-MED39]